MWTIIPKALIRATFLHTLYGWPYIPDIGIKNVFLWIFRTFTIMRRFCRIQPVQMHHHNLRRPMSSWQSVYHHPLMHDAPHNRQIPDTKRGERWSAPYLRCYLELLLRHGHLNVFSIRSTLDVVIWRKFSASYALGVLSISTKHYTDMSICCLILSYKYKLQRGIDGAHRQWCTLPYTMGAYYHICITRC